MAEVDAVEGPDRDRARPQLQLARAVYDLHAPILANASSSSTSRSGSASSTSKGLPPCDATWCSAHQLVGDRPYVGTRS